MITKATDIQAVRGVAINVAPGVIEPYIDDVEKQDVLPVIGAELYFAVDAAPEAAEYRTLLHGGTYIDHTGRTQYSRGLIIAVAYLAYARLLVFGDIQYTAAGAVLKALDYATRPSEVDKIRAADSAKKLGFAILQDVAGYVAANFNTDRCKPARVSRPKFVSIRKDKL